MSKLRCLLLLWLLALPVLAQSPDLHVEAWFSAGDNVHPDRFQPVTLLVENLGPERTLTVELRLGQLDVINPVQIRVPAGARQQYQLGIPHLEAWNNELDLQVRQSGKLAAQTKIKFQTMSEGIAVALLVPDGQSAFNYLQALNDVLPSNGSSSPPISLSTPRLSGLPTHWSGYLGVDLVVLYDLPHLNLTRAQQQALADWTRSGGVLALVSSGDPAEFRGSQLEEMLPVTPAGSRDEASFQMVTGSLRAGATTVQERGGHPTLAQLAVSSGQVYQFTFPILKDTVLGSDGTRKYWKPILVLANDRQTGANNFGMRTDNLLHHLSEMVLPSPGLLAWLLLGYVLLVGPINFAILKKRDRMLWIFVTVPVMAVGFTLGMFLTTQLAHGTVSVVREVSRLRLASGQERGLMDSQLIYFSPFPGEARARCPQPTTALLEPVPGSPEPQPAALLTEELTYPAIPMQMSSMRRFSCRSVAPLQGPITVRILKKQGQTVEFEVDNQSTVKLAQCSLVVGDRATKAFEVGPGKSREKLELGTADPGSLARDLLGNPDPDDGRQQDRVELMSRELMGAGTGSSGEALQPSSQGARVTLVGWTSDLGSGVELSGNPKKVRDCLVEVQLP